MSAHVPAVLQPPPLDAHTLALIRMAVREDMGHATYGTAEGDRTVELAIPEGLRGVGTVVARKAGVIAGTYLLEPILREYQGAGGKVDCAVHTTDGARVAPQQPVATLTGPVRTLLSAERVLLNFLGHLSGVATLTRRYVDVVAETCPDPARRPAVCDTRKTTPAFRALDKYAVRCGGGVNDRLGLYDGVMLKDNHLAALKDRLGPHLSLRQLTAHIHESLDPGVTLWLEVDTLDQLRDALPVAAGEPAGADIILLDNFAPEGLRQAVALRDAAAAATGRRPIPLESSGGVTLETLAAVARTGVDRISIGALTHSAPALDLSLELA
jgi:nicotinate-nucleotide pyrophosphorylase (carboxylating)